MKHVTVKKGYPLPIVGRPSAHPVRLKQPKQVAVLPEKIPFIKPRLQVQAGDTVQIGSVLFTDKRNPDLVFLSPGCGVIQDIRFGPRRVIREVVIQCDDTETVVEFEPVSETGLRSMGAEELVSRMRKGGVWPLIRELPYRGISDPAKKPAKIWVILGGLDPFQPLPEVYLKGKEGLFTLGLKILKRFKVPVQIAAPKGARLGVLDTMVTHRVTGAYPAMDPGVLNYHTRKSAAENLCWYLSGQDLLAIASLIKTGVYPVERVVVTGGSRVSDGKHLLTRLGVPVQHCIPEIADHTIVVAGGLFTGYEASPETHLGLYETSLTGILRGDREELFGFLRPGADKPSYSRTFLSVLRKASFDMDSGQHGEPRACVNCGTCTRVCPVDILPQYTMKALNADAIEEALAHGLLDCVECGLCSYVCPSKLELREVFRQARQNYYLEQQ